MDLVFIVYVLIQSQVSAKIYQQSTSECRFWNNIYKSAKVRSKIDCSSLCSQEPCSKFIYDSSTNMCDLHSDEIRLSDATKTPSKKSLFLSTHKDCNAPGYDFVESHNLCIKWYGGNYTWFEARELCQLDGGDLLTLEKMEKWTFIYQHLLTCPKSTIWLGLIDKTWVNSVPFQVVYNVTTSVDASNYDKSCVRLRLNANNYVLNDIDCMKNRKVLCEIPVY